MGNYFLDILYAIYEPKHNRIMLNLTIIKNLKTWCYCPRSLVKTGHDSLDIQNVKEEILTYSIT